MEIVELDRVEIAVEPYHWAFAAERRDEIDRYFEGLRRERSGVWNGRVVLLNRFAIKDNALRGACFETDFASLCAWREWHFPDASVHNIFAAAALRGADGAYLLGQMASHTAPAGRIYFPCGTPEPSDVDPNGKLDLAGNLCRELLEETGLDIGELNAEPGWTAVIDRGFFALMKRLTARQDADELRERIMRHIAAEREPELADIRIARGPADLDPLMPRFVVAFLEKEWRL